jgi:hypothetical protein
MFDPETNRTFYIEKEEIQDEIKDWDATLNDGLENLASEFELPPDTYLEETNKRIQEDRLLNNSSVSRWRKNKILNSRNDGEGEIKTY